MRKSGPLYAILWLGLALLLTPLSALSGEIEVSFYNLTGNSKLDLSNQLKLSIYDQQGLEDEFGTEFGISLESNQVLFVFRNLVGIRSSIHEIYMDDGTVLGLASVINSQNFPGGGGYTYYQNTKIAPGNLPGGEIINFQATDRTSGALSVDILKKNSNGLDASNEILGIIYDVYQGLDGIDKALYLGGADGGLRIGLHIAICEDGNSDSYVNKAPVPVPDGGLTVLLLGIGVGGAALFSRKFRK